MGFFDRITDVVDRVTKLPGQVSRRADDLNDRAIDFATDLQNALDDSAAKAEANLTRNKIASIGRAAADWISNPENLFKAGIAAGALFLIFTFIIRK